MIHIMEMNTACLKALPALGALLFTSTSLAAFQPGERVDCHRKKDGVSERGSIVRVNGETRVVYDNGSRLPAPLSRCTKAQSPRYTFKVGARVKCQFRKRGTIYAVARIIKKDGPNLLVRYYGNAGTEQTSVNHCRLMIYRRVTYYRGKNKIKRPSKRLRAAVKFTRIEARYRGDWKEWWIHRANGKREKLEARGHGEHMHWRTRLAGRKVKILTCIQGSKWWSKWQYRFGRSQYIAEARSPYEWRINAVYSRLKVRTRWNRDPSRWRVEGKHGTMKVEKYRNGFRITDNMPRADKHAKMAALFTIVLASSSMPR